PIVGRTERTLLNMADAYSRVSCGRKIGVAAVQHGPGSENAYAGGAQAFADGSPLLFLPGGYVAGRCDIAPNFACVRSYQSITKWSARVNAPGRTVALMRRAFTLLRSGRPAPVLIEVPTDVAAAAAEPFDYRPPAALRTAADPGDVREAVRVLLR